MKRWKKKILMIISVVCIILSFLLQYENKTIINVNDRNRNSVISNLNKLVVFETGRIKNIDSIKKVGVGNGEIHKYQIYIYYSWDNSKKLELYEGDTDETIEEVRNYIIENGYNLDTIGIILISISLVILFVTIKKG